MIKNVVKSSLFIMLFLLAGKTAFAEDKKNKGEIIVGFVKDTSQNDINAFQKKFNLTVIKPFKRICAIRYKVADSKDCAKLIASIKKEKIVRYVEMNGKVAKK